MQHDLELAYKTRMCECSLFVQTCEFSNVCWNEVSCQHSDDAVAGLWSSEGSLWLAKHDCRNVKAGCSAESAIEQMLEDPIWREKCKYKVGEKVELIPIDVMCEYNDWLLEHPEGLKVCLASLSRCFLEVI